MNKCALNKDDWAAFLSGDLEEERRKAMAEHLEKCRPWTRPRAPRRSPL
jgi:anti-sigma factor RsiW